LEIVDVGPRAGVFFVVKGQVVLAGFVPGQAFCAGLWGRVFAPETINFRGGASRVFPTMRSFNIPDCLG